MNQFFSYITTELQALLFTAPVILMAIVCHECAHGWISYRLGDPTAKNAGRLTLNPLKHLDPVGALCMLFFHVGWAKPVPINPFYYRNRRQGIILVSLAGPASNFILSFLSLLVEGILIKIGDAKSTLIWILCQLCYYSSVVNIGLGLFNLVPIPPLDGSKIAAELSAHIEDFYRKYEKYLRILLLVFVITGVLSKPLGKLNSVILNGMWHIIRTILRLNCGIPFRQD